jgi:CRP/FNR family cyclic AMP-dependent transcriptional regulator
MKRSSEAQLDLQAFLANANGGRAISTCRANQRVFAQGEPADSIFYIQEGKVKVTVLFEQGKEAIVAILGTGDFCGEGCLVVSRVVENRR